MAQRIDAVRSFFRDLIEWEWITPRFDPRRVISLPVSARAGLDPDQTIIDDAAWAKLMAAGLTLTADDLRAYGTPRARAAGWHSVHWVIGGVAMAMRQTVARHGVARRLGAGDRVQEGHQSLLRCSGTQHPRATRAALYAFPDNNSLQRDHVTLHVRLSNGL